MQSSVYRLHCASSYLPWFSCDLLPSIWNRDRNNRRINPSDSRIIYSKRKDTSYSSTLQLFIISAIHRLSIISADPRWFFASLESFLLSSPVKGRRSPRITHVLDSIDRYVTASLMLSIGVKSVSDLTLWALARSSVHDHFMIPDSVNNFRARSNRR
jgi:hypothetical protein